MSETIDELDDKYHKLKKQLYSCVDQLCHNHPHDQDAIYNVLTYLSGYIIEPIYDKQTIIQTFEDEIKYLASHHPDKNLLYLEVTETIKQLRELNVLIDAARSNNVTGISW
jgi:hypothetical protein